MTQLLLTGCEVDGRRVDVRLRDGVVADVAPELSWDGDRRIDAAGGVLLPGLHDHHIHLLALAASRRSVQCGPPAVRTYADLAATLQAAAARPGADAVIRGIGYSETVAGPLDRWILDALAPDVAVRVQHRGGAQWVLSSVALRRTGLEHVTAPEVERDAAGSATGRVHRGGHLLRGRMPSAALPLAAVGARLAAAGVTGVTDATPDLDDDAVSLLNRAELPQRVLLMGRPGAPRKVVLDEWRGLDAAAFCELVRAEHGRGTPVAIHCVTRAEVVLAIDTLRRTGALPGDRLEHASVLPYELDAEVRRLGLTVVTQPGLLPARGDDYLAAVDADDVGVLWRCGSLDSAGIRVAAGTDAPYGDDDPWACMRAAVARRTSSGAVLGPADRVSPHRALRLFLGSAQDPAGPARTVAPGRPADLCLLAVPLAVALDELDRDNVRLTLVGGEVAYSA